MSHIHLPDGILPVWLWLSGWLIIILFFILFRNYLNKHLAKYITLAAMFAAIMVIAQTIEIVPIAYHFNLSVVSGIFVGPIWMVVVSFIVNLILSMFGHGGITVVGINTLIIASEGIIGFYLFKFLSLFLNNLYLRGFISTFFALAAAALLAITIVAIGAGSLKSGLEISEKLSGSFDLNRFIFLVLAFGSMGWILESFLASSIITYINKVKPDLLK